MLAISIFGFPWFANGAAKTAPELVPWKPLVLAGLYCMALPFFFALYQCVKLLHYIDSKKAFSDLSVKALGHIKYCAIAVGVLLMAELPAVYRVADVDDAPGIMLIGLIIAFAPMVIATFVAVLQRLLQEVVEIKSENDSTI